MEIIIQPSFPLLPTFFFLFTIAFLTIRKRSKSTPNLPPGPRKLPLIGNIHNLVMSQRHHALRDLARKYGPLMHLRIGEVSMVVISSAEVAREVMKTHDLTFADRPLSPASRILLYENSDIAYSPYSEYWKQIKNICRIELLSAKQVRSFRWVREEELSKLVREITSSSGSPVNLTERLFGLTYGIIARSAFGKKCQSQERFVSLIEEATKLVVGFDFDEVFPSFVWLGLNSGRKLKLEKLHHGIDTILDDIVNDHKEAAACQTGEGGEPVDLIDVLLKFEDRGDNGFSLSPRNIKAIIFDMLVAGSESSATTVDWAMAEMIKRPEILAKARDEVRRVFADRGQVSEEDLPRLEFLSSIIKETLRLHPAAPLIPRECRERCEISGFKIPAKTRVIVNAWAIGRDPEKWTEPEIFDPERFLESLVDYKGDNFQYIPFGAGRRICPGMTYGVVTMEFQLAMLLYHFDWKLPDGMKNEDLDMTETFGFSVRRRDNLFLIPTPYRHFQPVPNN